MAIRLSQVVVHLPVPPIVGMAKDDSRSSDVNLKNLVRGQDEWNHAQAVCEPK